jgi:hypothetical protein
MRRTEASHDFGSATVAQSFPVESYAGKRVRVSLHVRFQGIDKMAGAVYIGTGSSSHSESKNFGDSWAWAQCILTLPADAKQLEIGVGLKGPGSAKVDAIELQVLGDAPADQRGTRISDSKLVVNGSLKDLP